MVGEVHLVGEGERLKVVVEGVHWVDEGAHPWAEQASARPV